MLTLLKIDLLKLRHYRTFWILTILYFTTMAMVTSGGMEFLKWLNRTFGAAIDRVDILRVPLYHFPDIWQNLTYVSTYFKIVLAIVVIISITNEFSYKTVRQNIIDGMDRKDFLISKILTITMLSLASTVVVFLIGLITGSIYSPSTEMRFIFSELEFVPAFFLDTFSYLLLVLMFSVVVKRSGLTIGLLLIYPAFEYIFAANLPDSLTWLGDSLPLHAINSLITVPFHRYAFMEIQDYVQWGDIALVIGYCMLFVFLSYRALTRRDLL